MPNPVQSIRVANALLGRFPGLMKQAAGTSSDVELAIGEANQLYPEIWRHLDDARRALGDRDVPAYDSLRATVLAELGITEIDTHSTDWYTRYGTYAGTTHQKVVHFNYEGYDRARSACKALMAAMPEIDWAELAREDVRAIAQAGSLHEAKYKKIGAIVAVGAILALVTFGIIYQLVSSGPSGDAISDEELAERRRISEAREVEAKARTAALDKKRARIDALRLSVKARCLPAEIAELATLLREEGQLTESKTVATARCIPARPRCKPLPGALLDRLAARYPSVLAAPAKVECAGILTAGTPRVPAVIVWFPDKGGVVRGVVSVDGATELVPFQPGPGTILVDVGDLEGDGPDEAVFATDRDLWVSKIAGSAFVDTPGPRSSKKCQENVSIERAREADGSTPDHLVIWVLDGKGCEADRHAYKLQGGALVED